MKRRDFLKFGAATAVLSAGQFLTWVPRAYAATVTKEFFITEGLREQVDGTFIYFKGFSESDASLNVPGASMVVQEGDTVEVTVHNTLNTDHNFFIDGLSDADSGVISPGESVTFSFVADKAGSYLYHDRLNAPYNRAVGLHGGLAVMPSNSSDTLYNGSPDFVKQLFWVFHEIDPAWHASMQAGDNPNSKYVPRYFTMNGISARAPGAPDYNDPTRNSFKDPRTYLTGSIGDRTLIRVLNAGVCSHSLHWHANHVEWLTENGNIRPDIWMKDVVRLDNFPGKFDVIYPFSPPPDAFPPVTTGEYVMHLHNEQTQTAGGGLYQFGAATNISFE